MQHAPTIWYLYHHCSHRNSMCNAIIMSVGAAKFLCVVSATLIIIPDTSNLTCNAGLYNGAQSTIILNFNSYISKKE